MKKPMLLSNDEFDLNSLDYTNMYMSVKRDGVRAEISKSGIQNRSLKILRNVKIQEFFREIWCKLPDNVMLEAEIYADNIPCREIAGICNSLDKDVPGKLKLYIFGIYDPDRNFEQRLQMLNRLELNILNNPKCRVVRQYKAKSADNVINYYDACIKENHEGVVLMDGSKKYKEGRVTIKQHIGFKLKPHKEIDLKIIGVTERLKNTNESQTNELGHSFKRNTVDAKENTGVAAAFICEYNGLETKVTITGDEAYRKEIWNNRDDYIGRYAVVKSMSYGEKDRLRHPRLIKVKLQVEK